MVYFISSKKYQPMINKILTETDQSCAGQQIGEKLFFKKFVKENITLFDAIEILIIDLTALADTDEEIMQGIESIRVMDYDTRFIIIATYHKAGDKLLKECFYAGIYDIIVSDEYLELSLQLTKCVCEGMRYKDALCYRDVALEDQQPESVAVQKILVGVAGSGRRMGSTHNSILIANFLREQKQMTAVMEMNQTQAFQTFCDVYKAKRFEDGYFSIKGIDFYPACDNGRILSAVGKLYNFLILDFGSYYEADKIMFNKCDVRILFSGTKPWEMGNLEQLFAEQEEEVLKNYHWCFLGTTSNKLQKEIVEHMKPLENVWFPEYVEDPFSSSKFTEGNQIFKEYLTTNNEVTAKKRKRWKG